MGVGLYDYQLDAVYRMHNGCILVGGVGSGKSRTGLGYYFLQAGGQFEPFSGPTKKLDLYIITTARKRDDKEWYGDLGSYLLTPGDSPWDVKVTIDSWQNIMKYKEVKDAFFIFDEQKISGSGAWVKCFLTLAKKNQWILLTATPGDTWFDYIPVFIANGFYRNRTEFMYRHAIVNRYRGYPVLERWLFTRQLEEYKERISIYMGYRSHCTQHHEIVKVEYDRELYFKVVKDRWNIFTDSPIINSSEYCQVLRRIVNSDESRAMKVLELAEDWPRLIIFYHFDYELEILKRLGYIPGTEVAEYNGHKHQPVPTSERWVYLVQYFSGAEAWNNTSTNAMIFYSDDYSYKLMVQSAGRIDRLTSPYNDLYYWHLRSLSPLDFQIGKALKEKRDFNENDFARSDGFA